jgi:hypothetical protein
VPILKPLLSGARERAAELGYTIEVHRPFADRIRPERLRQILTTRSQWALIIPPVPESAMSYPLDLRGLTGVTVGTSLHQPVMHRVSPNHYQAGQLACERLRGKGFRRIGLVLSPALTDRVEGKWLGAFLAEQRRWPSSQRLPPLLVDAGEPTLFDAWLRRHKPDVVLLAEPHVAAWLGPNGRSAASPLPVAWLELDQKTKNVWHIDYKAERIGAAAVELVMGQIHRNERGSPAVPHTMLLESAWVE